MLASGLRPFELPRPLAIAAGLALVAALALGARFAGAYAGPFPDVVVGLVAGALIGNIWGTPAVLGPGIAFTLRYVLRAAIILFGFGLSVATVVQTGGATLALILLCFAVAIALGFLVARAFGLGVNIGTLIGAGTAICGGSAILAIGPMLRAKDEESAYALTTIFTFNVIALIVYPILGHALRLTDAAFGSWTGTAINDTSVVVATAYAYSTAAGGVATIVKLTRTLLLVPLALVIGLAVSRGTPDASASVWSRVSTTVPWFVLGFVATAALRSAGVVPAPVLAWASQLAGFLILMVLVAVGLSVDVRKMARLGSRPLFAGLGVAGAMSVVSFALVAALHIR